MKAAPGADNSPLLARVDHLVYVAPDVDAAVDALERRLGVRASVGGRHLGKGTRNCLLALGPRAYLEIVGPDRAQPEPAKPRWFGIDELHPLGAPRLATWAAQAPDLDADVARAAERGIDLGQVLAGSRQRTDGTVVSWRVSDVRRMIGNGVVPFLIDWGESEHPAATATPGVTLVALRGEHPDPGSLAPALDALGLDLRVAAGPVAALVAELDTPRGHVELR